MSSYKSNSSVARTQSSRMRANPVLTAPPKSKSKSPVPGHKSASVAAEMPVCTSSVNLFLTNLRLLDLDLEPDWPDFTPTTLSAKDAGGGQKKRIRCVEWALYRLFLLWDQADAEIRLQPLYPPADQVQSINLRSALVRSLEMLKKNGILGRDVLIRKTMLDECKGERLEEVLAMFSSAVLKKTVSERAANPDSGYKLSIAERISLESLGYKGDRTELIGLLLAHKASLRTVIDNKNAARQKYRDFSELLAMKERRIARRQEQAKDNVEEEGTPMSDAEKSEIRRIVRTNWVGNEQWLDGLLLGDGTCQKSGLLSTPFEEVWDGVKAGSVTDFEDQTASLLEQLEKRVNRQQTRLQKWKDFHSSTFGHIRPRVKRDPLPEVEKNDKPSFDFTAHIGQEIDTSSIKFDNPPPVYTKLADELSKELDSLKGSKIPDFSKLVPSVRRGTISIAPEPIPESEPTSDVSEWEDEPEVVLPQPKTRAMPKSGLARPMAVPGGLVGSRRQLGRTRAPREDRKTSPVRRENTAKPPAQPRQPRAASSRLVQVEYQSDITEESAYKVSSQHEETRAPYLPLERPSCPEIVDGTPRPKSPTQALADEILMSINNASPSPVKKSRYALSLSERAQMSMARKMSFEVEDEPPEMSPIAESPTQSPSRHTLDKDNHNENGEEYEDLMARTQRSMSGYEAVRQKAQMEMRRSQRKSSNKLMQRRDSYFSKVDEEDFGDLSIVEGLIENGQEDYEAVFKSRPRIANSPAQSQYGFGY